MTLKIGDFEHKTNTPDGKDTVPALLLVCDTNYNAKIIPNGVLPLTFRRYTL